MSSYWSDVPQMQESRPLCVGVPKRGSSAVRQQGDELSADAEGTYFLGSVDGQGGAWYQKLTLEGTPIEFKVDKGADISLISETHWSKIGKPKLQATSIVLDSPGGKIAGLGKFTASTTYREKSYSFRGIVMKRAYHSGILAQ